MEALLRVERVLSTLELLSELVLSAWACSSEEYWSGSRLGEGSMDILEFSDGLVLSHSTNGRVMLVLKCKGRAGERE